MRILSIGLIVALLLSLPMLAADISGTWKFSVDVDGGGHGDPTFVLIQKGAKVTGTYSGPVGEQKVAGTVNGNAATFGFSYDRDGATIKATYTAKIESAKTMAGTVQFENPQGNAGGKFTATKE
jgi:hypothetical protein